MLTDTLIRNAKPKQRPYTQPKESGLTLIVNPDGSKWWRFNYRFGGKQKTISLGTYPLIPLNLARQRRDNAATPRAGSLPKVYQCEIDERTAQRTIQALARDGYLHVGRRFHNGHPTCNVYHLHCAQAGGGKLPPPPGTAPGRWACAKPKPSAADEPTPWPDGSANSRRKDVCTSWQAPRAAGRGTRISAMSKGLFL